ncbi:hypothetical protein N9B71_03940, partial [Pirellulales bacterium]|nr:hypothetical protein [Pirellulales bacterium]
PFGSCTRNRAVACKRLCCSFDFVSTANVGGGSKADCCFSCFGSRSDRARPWLSSDWLTVPESCAGG